MCKSCFRTDLESGTADNDFDSFKMTGKVFIQGIRLQSPQENQWKLSEKLHKKVNVYDLLEN